MIDREKCLSCVKIIRENYGNMELHPCLECIEKEARMTNKVCVSGGFDPLHVGHLRHMQEAAKFGDLIVILNSDEWLQRKKGFVFMKWEERAEIIKAYSFVKGVVQVDDSDGTVCEALRRIKPDFYCKGGDRGLDNTPEVELCGHLGIGLRWGVGGDDKVQASSRLVEKAIQSKLQSSGIIRGLDAV